MCFGNIVSNSKFMPKMQAGSNNAIGPREDSVLLGMGLKVAWRNMGPWQ